MRPYVLGEATWKAVQSASYEVAVLPWGATEAHNYHLPYATDVYEASAIATEASRIATEQGGRVIGRCELRPQMEAVRRQRCADRPA